MRKLVFLITFFLITINLTSQEINCLVNVNFDQIAGSNRQVFETLETALTEFINQKKWTNRVVQTEERVDCVMNIIITSRDNNTFTAIRYARCTSISRRIHLMNLGILLSLDTSSIASSANLCVSLMAFRNFSICKASLLSQSGNGWFILVIVFSFLFLLYAS